MKRRKRKREKEWNKKMGKSRGKGGKGRKKKQKKEEEKKQGEVKRKRGKKREKAKLREKQKLLGSLGSALPEQCFGKALVPQQQIPCRLRAAPVPSVPAHGHVSAWALPARTRGPGPKDGKGEREAAAHSCHSPNLYCMMMHLIFNL